MNQINPLCCADPELEALVSAEHARQQNELEMIASESLQPAETLRYAGSVFNNKTAVGGIGHQRLQGSEVAEQLEQLAADRACRLFGAEHANLTPYSGSMANFCAYGAFVAPGERILALDPACGAHQTHGGKNNITSKVYEFDYFGLRPDTLAIDYDGAEALCRTFKPKLIVVGSAAYPRNIDYRRLADIAHDNNAYLMADVAHFSGLIAAGLSPNPVPFADVVTGSGTKTMCGPHTGFVMCKSRYAEAVEHSVYPGHVASLHLQTIAALAHALQIAGTPAFRTLMERVLDNASYLAAALQKKGFGIFTGGTDCHLMLCDVSPFGINGVDFANALNAAGITVNSKALPFCAAPVATGVRLGTTVLSQRGMGRCEMDEVADLFAVMAGAKCSNDAIEIVRARVAKLCAEFPLPQ